MTKRILTAVALSATCWATVAGAADAPKDPARYIAGAPQLMMQVCSAFLSGRPMAPVLQELDAWPAHEPLRHRLLGERNGRVFLTRQFGYGLYAMTFEAGGRCSVEVFAVPTDLARERFAIARAAAAPTFTPGQALLRDEAGQQETPLLRNDQGGGLDLRLQISEDAPGLGSASFVLVRKQAPRRSI